MATVDELIQEAQTRMGKSVEHARNEFGTVRTGRASAALLDRIAIDYYGTVTPLKQVATIGVPEARMLTVQPFDTEAGAGGAIALANGTQYGLAATPWTHRRYREP